MSIIRISTTPGYGYGYGYGYADPSLFTRAFKRWSGLAPSEWREKNKQ